MCLRRSLARIKQLLGDRVRDVREGKTLVDSPAPAWSRRRMTTRELQYVRRVIEEDYVAPAKTLEIDRHHPIVANLRGGRGGGSQPFDDPSIEQLFTTGTARRRISRSVADMVERIQKLMGVVLHN